MVVGSLVSNAATGAGLMAAAIAVGGFITHAAPALAGRHDPKLRKATVIGGLCGLTAALLLIVLSAFVGYD